MQAGRQAGGLPRWLLTHCIRWRQHGFRGRAAAQQLAHARKLEARAVGCGQGELVAGSEVGVVVQQAARHLQTTRGPGGWAEWLVHTAGAAQRAGQGMAVVMVCHGSSAAGLRHPMLCE